MNTRSWPTLCQGTIPAIVTPFTNSGDKIDWKSFENLFEHLVSAGVTGVVVAGSTGEAATLSDSEYFDLITRAVEINKGRINVIAGVGTNDTVRAINAAEKLEAVKVDALLVVTPPYNKPSQEGLYAHFEAISNKISIPVIGYNVPGRTGVTMQPQTTAALWSAGIIAGIKDATGSVDHALDTLFAANQLKKSSGNSKNNDAHTIPILSGEDSLVHPIMACGGSGTISATANVVAAEMVALTTAALSGEYELAARIQLQILPVVRAMFCESNPVPVKAALKLRGLIEFDSVRLPLLTAKEQTVKTIENAFKMLEQSV